MVTTTDFEFLEELSLNENSLNGLQIKNLYIPEEIILTIFTYLNPSDILKCSLVCKRWFNIAKSNALWQTIYNEKEYPKKAKNLPWYAFYSYFSTDNFKNLIQNGNGQEMSKVGAQEVFKHWTIVYNGGDKFQVEKTPQGCDPLPEGVPEFKQHKSCFVTSYERSFKYQTIDLKQKHLLRHIIKKYKPALYASEWYAGRFDCACFYKLILICNTKDLKWSPSKSASLYSRSREPESGLEPNAYYKTTLKKVEQWSGKAWEKVVIVDKHYPNDIETIFFGHEGGDLQFWKGHYGSKMAGGVLRFDFDSIEPLVEDGDN